MSLPPEKLLNDRYQIERMLGKGGMGAVYLAQDHALDTYVAVKVNLNPAPQSSTQFLREARLLAALRHTNLPRVIDYFILNEAQYLVMDYVPGKDLDTLLKEEGAQPLEKLLVWMREIGGALSYLHSQVPPIIHRDVKPANVRLSTEGEAILVDFGIAKVIDKTQQMTTTGAMGYTPGYAPPEQYGGAVRTGPYTDQYSLGALIYHMLTGQKPVDSVQRALGNEEIVPLRSLKPEIPAYVQAAIERSIALRPEERFPSVDAFLDALNPPKAEQTITDDRTVMVAPGPGEATVVVPQGGAAPDGLTQRVPQPPPPSYPVERPPARSKGPGRWFIAIAALVIIAGLGVVGVLTSMLKIPGLSPQPTQVSQAAIVVTDTPKPIETATTRAVPATATQAPSETTAPTVQPSATITLTDTPVPSPTPFPLGGGGVVVFASDRADGKTFQLWRMRVSLNDQGQVVSSDVKQITDSPGSKSQPAWSPDGTRLLYVAPGEKNNGLDIWMINADGSGVPADLTGIPGDENEPCWSPDGKWIAFSNNGRSDKLRQVYLIRPDGRDRYRLSFDQEEFGPTWAPDLRLGFVMNVAGNQTMYIRGQVDPQSGAAPTREYYVTPVFFDLTALTGSLGQVSQPAWSPDGKWLVYTRQRYANNQIYLAHFPVRVVEQDVLKLTSGPEDGRPGWSPDGQWIIFSTKRDGNFEIYVMRSNGTSQMNASAAPGQDIDPAWQPVAQ